MNCKFCKKECVIGEYDGWYPRTAITIYECNRHPLVVKHYVDLEEWFNTIIKVPYRNKIYIINWLNHGFRIDCGSVNNGSISVLFLPFHPPDLTPENIESKLPLYITFS